VGGGGGGGGRGGGWGGRLGNRNKNNKYEAKERDRHLPARKGEAKTFGFPKKKPKFGGE